MPNSVCVDAGCVVRFFTEPTDESIQERWRRWHAEGTRFVAPSLLRYEVTNALHRSAFHGPLSEEAARSALRSALEFPIAYEEPAGLHLLALDFARRFALPAAYDAHYLALADHFDVELWTIDRRLAQVVRPSLLWVRLVGE